jgi:hypothetical protein
LGKLWEYFGQTTTALHLQVGFDLHISHRIIAVPCLVVLGHLYVSVPHLALNVFLLETLLYVQPGAECAYLVKGGALTGRHVLVGLRIVLRLGEDLVSHSFLKRSRRPLNFGAASPVSIASNAPSSVSSGSSLALAALATYFRASKSAAGERLQMPVRPLLLTLLL